MLRKSLKAGLNSLLLRVWENASVLLCRRERLTSSGTKA